MDKNHALEESLIRRLEENWGLCWRQKDLVSPLGTWPEGQRRSLSGCFPSRWEGKLKRKNKPGRERRFRQREVLVKRISGSL